MTVHSLDALAILVAGEPVLHWSERITTDPTVLVGKPIIRNTRIAVEFIVELLAEGWTQDEVLRNYPQLTSEDIHAALGYASARLKEEVLYPLPV